MFNKLAKSLAKRIPQIKQVLDERDTLRKERICQEHDFTTTINILQDNMQNLQNENLRLNDEINNIKRDIDHKQHNSPHPEKIVVYTAIYGDKDNLKEPSVELDACSLVCFTDDKHLKSKVFDIRFFPSIHSDPARSAKIFKILPHYFLADYEYSLWIDSSIIFKRGDIQAMIDNYLCEHNMAVFAHPDRQCIYDEAEACINWQKDNAEIITKQVKQYRDEGYPPHNGLTENTIILRRHMSTDVIRVEEDWWAQILRFSRRDQLSFNYVAWKNNFMWASIKGNLRENEYFSVQPHKQ
jgi:hypothetical protein